MAVDPVLSHAAAGALAAVLLSGLLDKLRAPGYFFDAVANFRLLPAHAVRIAACAVMAWELASGVLLLPVATRPLGALLAAGLLMTVTAAILINIARGRTHIDCGCGGDAHTPLSAGLVVRNGALVLLAILSAAPHTARQTFWLDWLAAVLAGAFMVGLYITANTLLHNQSRLNDPRYS